MKQLYKVGYCNRISFFVLLLGIFLNDPGAIAQQVITGTPITGEQGVTLTVDQIMAMEHPMPFKHIRIRREHEAHLNKAANPDAPAISSYPPTDNTGERNGGDNSINATQTIGASWRSVTLSISGGWIPPDCNGATGPTQVLACANTRIQVFDKAGVLGPLDVDLNTFFTSVRNGSGVSDTHIRYDRLSQRWFVVTINVASSKNRVCIAVSSGPVITGTASFTFFYFVESAVTGEFFDYPTLGVDKNALYIGGNRFAPGFTGSMVFVVQKSSILGAGPIVFTPFRGVATGASGIYTPQGVDNDDPSATEGYFVGTDAAVYSQLDFVRITTPGGVPAAVIMPNLTVPTTTGPISQVTGGTATRLDGLDDRPFAAHVMKNKLTGVTTLWTAHNIQVNNVGVASGTGGRNGSRWYQVGNMTGTPTLVQSGTLYDGAASNMRGFWIPSIAMSGQGHALLGSSTTSAVNFADAQVAGRYSCDALGTLQPFALATSSGAAYNLGGTTRWGDYSQVVVDPNDNMTMWAFLEYCDVGNDWAVRVVKLMAPPPPPTASLTPLSNRPCGSSSILVNIVATSTPNCTGFFDPGPDVGGPGFANHISSSISGGGISVNSTTFVDATHVNISLNATTCVPGTYTITITNPDGQTTSIPITFIGGLPVELISFTAQPTDKNILLKWATASETNSDYFSIEKSRDAKQFEKIGTVKGAGNTTTLTEYTFVDEHPLPGISYYRLHQVDFNHAEDWSKVVSAEFGKVSGVDGIYTDYSKQTINIYLNYDDAENVTYRVVDVLGNINVSGAFTSSVGSNLITIDSKQLVHGVYFLTVSTPQNILTKKIFY